MVRLACLHITAIFSATCCENCREASMCCTCSRSCSSSSSSSFIIFFLLLLLLLLPPLLLAVSVMMMLVIATMEMIMMMMVRMMMLGVVVVLVVVSAVLARMLSMRMQPMMMVMVTSFADDIVLRMPLPVTAAGFQNFSSQGPPKPRKPETTAGPTKPLDIVKGKSFAAILHVSKEMRAA